jgi:hypothetical protein
MHATVTLNPYLACLRLAQAALTVAGAAQVAGVGRFLIPDYPERVNRAQAPKRGGV